MKIENIESAFKDYLKIESTQFAILINGAFGSGKTYFWEKSLKKIAEENKFKTIYISLNGISKIETLENRLFSKLLPYIGNTENRFIKFITSITPRLLNGLSKKYFIDFKEIVKEISFDNINFLGYVICFDDLERCQISIKEVLGFINYYVEHKCLKTIILADETKIDSSQQLYDNIKEKVIGRILNFELDIKSTVPQLFKKYEKSDISFYKFLSINNDLIINILSEYKQHNLRITSFYLDILRRIHNLLTGVDQKCVTETLLFSALITIEFKNGGLKSSDIEDTKGIDLIDDMFSYNFDNMYREKGQEDDKPKTYAQIFYQLYLKETRLNQYFFYQSIYDYILSGHFDSEKFQEEIKLRLPIVLTEEVQCLQSLITYKFRDLTDEEFSLLVPKTLSFANEGKYFIYDYASIANLFFYFSDNKIIEMTNDEVHKVITNGIEIAKKRKEINDRDIENLLHFQSGNEEVEKVKQSIKKAHDEVRTEEKIKEGNNLINCFSNDEYSIEEIFKKYNLSNELFKYLNADLLSDSITKSSNKKINLFTYFLEKRYKSTNIGEFLFEDNSFLNKLKTNLETYLKSNNNMQPRRFLLETLTKSLDKICAHLIATRKHGDVKIQ